MPRSKYGFEHLQIGDSVDVPGNPSAIRSAASMWGTRCGIWLTTKTIEGGCTITRVEFPRSWKKPKRKAHRDSMRIKEIHDGIRCLTVLVCKIQERLAEIEDRLEK